MQPVLRDPLPKHSYAGNLLSDANSTVSNDLLSAVGGCLSLQTPRSREPGYITLSVRSCANSPVYGLCSHVNQEIEARQLLLNLRLTHFLQKWPLSRWCE